MLSLLISLKNYDMIGGAGAYLYLKGFEDIKFSQKKFLGLLKENPDFYNAFITTCATVFANSLHAREEIERIDTTNMNDDIRQKIAELEEFNRAAEAELAEAEA